ncbi:DUF6157 family protein [Cytophaga hutchinsonii]|uniref:Uncharacterized protein n=1 Tax=Cytophaga hutchinsonii (strain ATCC 33406 / DSM 1761 / CIP 103989 / NBRC 15051 / NCIMB 9469 / D465) TaxID=269798 RepID=A0A6N4SRQ5_CYTH3|nr:DUF6157 family protein [Cytophaga hutchinsonii]ABG58992.1 conserved hypothetical protein [Cytophaga hutchinsonii ATCC 33406]SFX39366.1 hypothetical protein SAMN04487930_103317 [Cytophaga hutchinsonii ATCC 33406]
MILPDKTHTTNYSDTFIEVADDCSVSEGKVPEVKNDKKTIAFRQFEMLSKNPYKYTSDDVLFQVYADKNDLIKSEYEAARKAFFSKGQACFRASPLTKQFGFGVHADKKGKIALYGMETEEYQKFVRDPDIKKVKAMRTSKK